MRSSLIGGMLAFCMICGHAHACLNDTSLPDREREFRSQYESNYTSQVDEPREQLFAEGPVLPTVGVVAFAGAVCLAWFGARGTAHS